MVLSAQVAASGGGSGGSAELDGLSRLPLWGCEQVGRYAAACGQNALGELESFLKEHPPSAWGDDVPDDELNRLTRAGQHFGYPYCHAGSVADPEFGKQRACSEFEPPAAKLGAHVAALGMRFYTGTQFPAEYRNSIFIAEHGSWNRTKPVGYRVVRVVLNERGQAVRQEVFAQGWLQGDKPWGRPADVQVAPDGSLLVSDDMAGAVYRIRYAP